MYALSLQPGTDRILSVTTDEFAPAWEIRVETLPEGDISNYRYTNNGFVYDPTPLDKGPAVEHNIEAGKLFSWNGNTYRAIMAIAKGEYVTERNAEQVSIEEYLNTLNAQEVT